MMSSRFNTGAVAPTTDVVADFAYAPMQPYVGFDPGMATMPNDRPPLPQHHLYDNLDFAAAFPFQEPALLSACSAPNSLQPLAPQLTMPMAMPMAPSSLQMPMMTLPGVTTAGDLYPFGAGGLVKREDGPVVDVGGGGIGLNLGRRTYFSPADVLAVDRLLMRSRLGGVGAMGVLGLGLGAAHHHQPPRCQAEGCKADLSAAKHYHRRHKVCEYHAKAAEVAAGGKQQRFCQQCSRFHVLAEFDEAKRSCRKRLTEHNRRRRKPASAQAKVSPPLSKKADTSITCSYTSNHKTSKSMAISSNASGISCLELDNGQTRNAAAAPTTLSLAATPSPHYKDGLDTMLMMQQVQACREEDEQHFMMTSLVQSSHQHYSNSNDGGSGNGNILSCLSVSDQQNSSCNGGNNDSSSSMHFFEVDFM